MATSVESSVNPSGAVVVPAEFLDRILDRLDRMERRIEQLAAPVEQVPPMIAAVADTVDGWTRQAQDRGLDPDAALAAGGPLLQRLADPDTIGRLERILGRLDAVENSLDVADQLPGLVAMIGDVVDDLAAKAHANGVDLDASLKAAAPALAALAEPRVLQAVETLAKQAPDIAGLIEQGPHLIAGAVDSLDGLMARLTAQGVDVQALSESIATAFSKLGDLLNSPQYKALMNSGVLDPSTLDMVGKAGSALVHARMEPCVETGMFGALRATSDKDVQRAIGFAIKFANAFGQELSQPDNLKHLAALSQPSQRLP